MKTNFYRKDSTLEMNSLVGFPIVEYSTKWLVDNEYICPVKCIFFRNEHKKGTNKYHEDYNDLIVDNEERNNIILKICDENKNKKILIITKLVKHAHLLGGLINNSIVIIGSTNTIERKNNFDIFKEQKNGILIGTHSIFSTGVNLPDLDILINTTANKSDIITLQSIGRIMRKSKDKQFGYYYDFVDLKNRMFFKAAKDRIKGLENFGHNIEYKKL